GFTALPVVDDDGALVGIVTEADVLRGRVRPDPRSRPAADRPDPPRAVGEVMTVPVVTVRPGTDLAEVAALMVEHGRRALPVLDGDILAGIVTRRDLVRCLGRDDAGLAAEVRRRLALLDGPGHWTVVADAGLVTLAGHGSGPGTAASLAGAVPGVTAVHVTPGDPPDPDDAGPGR
ncbi:MAG TPA: CBS domain-containing protein, partial [Pseudonocardiaceae bacterium]